MQIHELNTLVGTPGEIDFLAIDNGTDTSKISAKNLLKGPNDEIKNIKSMKVNQPLDANNQPTNGTNGQILRTRGNGKTDWVNVGLPTDAQTAQAVSDWLNAHPEATTTVQDGSITRAKLNSAIANSINGEDYYFPSTGTAAEFRSIVASGLYKSIYLDSNLSLEFNAAIQPAVGVKIYGNGAKIKRAAQYDDILFDLTDDNELHDVIVDGNKDNVTNGNWSRTVDIHLGGDNIIIDNIFLQNGCEAIMVVGYDCIIQNSIIKDCRGNGIHLGQAYRTIIKNNYIANTNLDEGLTQFNNGMGCIYFCRIVFDTVIDGNYLYNGRCGIDGLNTDTTTIDNSNVKIVNNNIISPRLYAINGTYQAYEDDLSATKIIIANNSLKNTTSTRIPIRFTNTASTSYKSEMLLIIANNIMDGVSITLYDCKSVIVADNVINGNIEISHCEKMSIRGNIIRTADDNNAITMNASTDNIIVTDNNIMAVGYPLYLDGNCRRIKANNNYLISTNNALSYAMSIPIYCEFNDNYLKFAGSTGIIIASKNVICKGNTIIADTASVTAIKVYGGSNQLIIADNVCNSNASFSFGSTMTSGRIEDNYVMADL